MVRVAFIRHGVTAWNREGRIQGRTDIPLCPEGREALATRRLPAPLLDMKWVTSPLARARETAAILLGSEMGAVPVEARIVEMSWGQWEGALLADLRQQHGLAMVDNEARGLHFRPPGGETPFEVQLRVREWLVEIARAGDDTVAVSHKGVIRAIMAYALGWDMTGKAPVKLDWQAVHVFEADADGGVSAVGLNGGNDHG